MEWFSTRAQIIQTVCSGISGIGAAIAIVGLIAHSQLPSPKLVLYLSLTVLFLAVLFFTRRWSIPFLRGLIPPPPLCGSVELLTVRIDMGDLQDLDLKTWEHSVEVRLLKDGKAQEASAYVADSERTIGDFLYRYSKDSPHGLEFVAEKDIYEEMSDLASRLRTPLAPDTHAEGWVRFELKQVKHQLSQCHITIYAVDANDKRHEIEAAGMRLVDLDSREYIVAKTPAR